jgi:hypothetical protein
VASLSPDGTTLCRIEGRDPRLSAADSSETAEPKNREEKTVSLAQDQDW